MLSSRQPEGSGFTIHTRTTMRYWAEDGRECLMWGTCRKALQSRLSLAWEATWACTRRASVERAMEMPSRAVRLCHEGKRLTTAFRKHQVCLARTPTVPCLQKP